MHPNQDDTTYARLRAFAPQAVFGPCFSTGSRSSRFNVVTPVYGRPARFLLILAAAMVVCCSSARSVEETASTPGNKDIFYVIPHTHWEGAVFLTREEYLDIGLPNILRALRLLKAHPNYRFTLDQACYVRPFLERYPEEVAAFRQFIKEGRLAIVCGNDVMLDVNMPGGESYVRQVLYGKGYFRKKLGRRCDHRLGARYFWAPRTDAAIVEAGRVQVVLVLPRRGRLEDALGVSLGGDRRLADSRLLAAARLRHGLWLADYAPGVYEVLQGAI